MKANPPRSAPENEPAAPSSVEAASPQTDIRFTDYALPPDVLSALAKMGIERPTPIQEKCIPSILEGRDVIGKAETGTGKTIGFGAPLVGKIDTHRVAVQALVLTPTRELAQQVAGVIEALGAERGLGVVLVVGGVHASEQVLKLRSRSQVVVGTPGRVLDFLRDRTLSLVWCETVVLDEADRMLDMGFIDDVTAILDKIPPERQTLLFSATVPPEVQKLMRRYMRNPVQHETSSGLSTVSEIRQYVVECDFNRKFKALEKILDTHADRTVIIFCNTKRQAIDLDRMLWGHGYSAGALHGDQEQDVRFKVLESFRKGEVKILVATDVASRGLDIEDVACVVNYEIPDEPESYVHRIGRTGRAQRSGEAISIVAGKERSYWQRILRQTGFKIERLLVGRRDSGHRPHPGSGQESRPPRGGDRHHERGPRAVAPEPLQGGEAGGEGRDEGVQGGSPPAGAEAQGAPAAREHRREGDGGERRGRRRRGRRGGGPREGRGGPEAPRQQASEARELPEGEALSAGATNPAPAGWDEEPGTGEVLTRWNVEKLNEAPKHKGPRLKLEEVGEEFFKTEYFDVDAALLPAEPPPSARPAEKERQGQGPGGEGRRRRRGRRGGGGERREPSQGRESRPGHGHGGQSHGHGHGHAHGPGQGRGSHGHGSHAHGGPARGEGGGRRRRRRGRGGRGRGQGGGASGPAAGGG